MKNRDPEEIRQAVRKAYGGIAKANSARCGCSPAPSCCGEPSAGAADPCMQIGYTPEDLRAAPEGSNMGLGCGNPTAIAALKPGETVLDLGSGAGFDCFLAARQVGEAGKVIGVDMTAEMISKARENARKAGYTNVDFRLGEIEHLPVADESIDVILSNCVINLSPDKPGVYRDAFRVLRRGGRLAIADVVATKPLADEVRDDLKLLAECVAGAATIEEIEEMLREIGFQEIRITPREESRELIRQWAPGLNLDGSIVSATIEAVKPLI